MDWGLKAREGRGWGWGYYNIVGMASSFLEKFKGKTQQVGKEGLAGLMADPNDKDNKVTLHTNIQFMTNTHIQREPHNPPQIKKTQLRNSSSRQKPQPPHNNQPSHNPHVNPSTSMSHASKPQPNSKVVEERSPFYVMNPFCLDDEQPGEPFNPPLSKKEVTAASEKQQSEVSYKEISKKSTVRGSSTDAKGWTKLGGLGANIGSDDWQEKKKKQDKMLEFAEQVKQANQDKTRERKPFESEERDIKRDKDKEKTIRQKALEYSKNIQKPVVRKPVEAKKEPEPQDVAETGESQLEEYERRHKQLQKLLNK